MSFLSLTNGKQFDFSTLKAGLKIDVSNEFLKKYDGNNNSIWDSDEIESFQKDAQKYAGDDKLDNNEAINWYANIMNMSVDKIRQMFANKEVADVNTSVEQVFYEQGKLTANGSLFDKANEALEMYETAQGGYVSQAWNGIKNFLNTKNCGKKAYRQIANQYESIEILETARRDGHVTKRDFINAKLEQLYALLQLDKLSADKQQYVKDGVLKLSPGELNKYIQELTNAEDEDYTNVVSSVMKDISNKNYKNTDSSIVFLNNPNSIDAILNSAEADDTIAYEDVFKLITGVDFDSNQIANYEKVSQDTANIIEEYNTNVVLSQNLEKSIKNSNKNQKQLSSVIILTMNNLYHSMDNAIEELSKLTGSQVSIEDGSILFDGEQSSEKIVELSEILLNNLKEQQNKILNGKSIEDYVKEMEIAYGNAYGNLDITAVAEAFAQSQEVGVGAIKTAMSLGGIALSICSGGVVLPLVGMAVATFAPSGISVAEARTKQGGMTEEDKQAIKQELLFACIFCGEGVVIGKASSVIGKAVAKACPTLMSKIAEYGSDFVMSILADYVTTGEIYMSAETLGEFINIAAGIVTHHKVAKYKNNNNQHTNTAGSKNNVVDLSQYRLMDDICASTPSKRLVQNHRLRLSGNHSRNYDSVMALISNVCKKYGYDEADVREYFLRDLDIKLNIFTDEASLHSYIEECFNIFEAYGKDKTLKRTYYNYRNKSIESYCDFEIIKKLALLNTTSPDIKIQLDRACYLLQQGRIDNLSFENLVRDLEVGYVSPNTIDLALSSSLVNNGHLKVEDLYDANKPAKEVKKSRKKILDTIERFSPEIKSAIKNLKKEIGDDIYNVKWETLQYKNITKEQIYDLITDIPNIKRLKQTEILPEDFYIKIKGFGENQNWAGDMSEIANYAAKLIEEGYDFDIVMQEIAKYYRDVDIKYMNSANFDRGKAESGGVLRCNKRGYMSDSSYENHGAITPFSDPKSRYNSYASRFYATEQKPLNNPYEGIFDLTRIEKDIEYPLDAKDYNPNNPKHIVKYDASGQPHYYEISDCMAHPKGKYAGAALDLVNEKQALILKEYKGKKLSKKDLNDINERIGEIHWILSHSMPWGRGSAGISDAYVKSLYKSLGIKVSGPREGISYDLEAFCTELDDYKKNYKNLYETEPEFVG